MTIFSTFHRLENQNFAKKSKKSLTLYCRKTKINIMADFFKTKLFFDEKENENPMQLSAVLTGANLEILREIRFNLQNLDIRLNEIETKIKSLEANSLTREYFEKNIEGSEQIVEKIIDEVRMLSNRPILATNQQLTLMETKNVEKIITILKEYGKLTASQLASIMKLSRTRCSEYFNQMENLSLVEAVLIGKEKYYRIKD